MMKKIISQINKLPIQARATFAFMFASVLERAVQMITSPIFTRLLSTDEFGRVSIYNSYSEIIGLFALLSLSSGIFNNGMFDFKTDRDGYIKSNLLLSNMATVITFLVVIVLKYIGKETIIPFDYTLIFIMFLLFISKPAYRFWFSRSRFEYKYVSIMLISIFALIISSITSICVILNVKDRALGRIAGRDICLFLIYLFFYIWEMKKGRFQVKYIKYSLGHSIKLIPYYLSKYILNHFDQVMISSMVSNAAAGIYSVAYTAGFGVKIIWEAINSAITPWLYGKIKKNDLGSVKALSNQVFIFYAIITVLISLVSPEIMKILASSEYYEGIYCIPPIVCGTFFVGLTGWFSIVNFYNKSSSFLSKLAIILAILNIGLNYIGIILWGYIAAAYTTMICYMIQCVAMYRSIIKSNGAVFDGRFIVTVSMLTVVASISSMSIFSLLWLRLILAFICCIFLLKTMKQIIEKKSQ